MRIGIFGGTFNPIHLGHLLLAETARETLSLDRVVFIPAAAPPHKSSKALLAGEVRLQLVELAIKGNPYFVASSIELERPGPSYTIQTVEVLHSQLPQAKLFLLVGQDMLSVTWRSWKELKRLCTVAVARRLQAKPSRQSGIRYLPMPQVDISSTDIRQRLNSGKSVRYLLPSAVAQHIYQHRLYQKTAA